MLCAPLLALACAGSPAAGPGAADAPAPEREDLAELTALSPPADALPKRVASVDRWTLRGPAPAGPGASPIALTEPHEAALRDQVDRSPRTVVPTESLRCLARERAWFQLEHAADPDDEWMTFVRSRCQSTTSHPRVSWLEGPAPPALTDEALLESWRAGLDEMLARELRGGPFHAGIGFARHEGRAVIALAVARERVIIERFDDTYPANGRVSLIGSVTEPADAVSAVIGLGTLGATPCVSHPGSRLPAFHFVCEGDPSDPWNFVSVVTLPPEQILTQAGALLLVRSPGEPALEFRRRFYTSPYEPGPRESLDAVIASELNRVRARVGLAPLELAPAQGRTAAALAPHYFAAVRGTETPGGRTAREVQELVAVGMVAGWDVEGVVADGSFSAARAPRTRDVSRLLSAALQHPVDRMALLDPAATRLAVGVLADPEGGLGAVFGSYALLGAESNHQAAGALLGRLIAERAARGLPAPGELRGVDTLAMQAAARVQAGEDRDRVLQELLEASSRKLMVGVSGFGGEAGSLDEIAFSEELLTSPNIGVAVGLVAHRPPGAVRGHWIVFVVTAPIGGWY